MKDESFSPEYIKILFLLGTNYDKNIFLSNKNLKHKELYKIYQNELNSDFDTNLKQQVIEHPNFNWVNATKCLKYEKNITLKNSLIKKKITHYPLLTCPRFFYWLLKYRKNLKSDPLLNKIINCLIFILCSCALISFFNLNIFINILPFLIINILWFFSKGFNSKLWNNIMKQYRNILFIAITFIFLSAFIPVFIISIIAILFEPKKYFFYDNFYH